MRLTASLFASVSLALACTPALAKPGDVLDRSHLVGTFAEECRQPGVETRFKDQFATGDQSGYGALDSRTLKSNGELEVYMDPASPGDQTATKEWTPAPLGVQPFASGGGACTITAARAHAAHLWGMPYTSGLLTTEGRFAQQYGYFEAQMQLPKGKGLWPAFWLLPTDKSWPPELDVMEGLGHDTQTFYATVHSAQSAFNNQCKVKRLDASQKPVTFGLLWTATDIVWYQNDIEVCRQPTPPDAKKPMYLLVDLAVGGPKSWPGAPDASTAFPAVLRLTHIRAYRLN